LGNFIWLCAPAEQTFPRHSIQIRTDGEQRDPLPDKAHVNWRQQSRVSEVWLLKD
jgi:hypothetical protein